MKIVEQESEVERGREGEGGSEGGRQGETERESSGVCYVNSRRPIHLSNHL